MLSVAYDRLNGRYVCDGALAVACTCCGKARMVVSHGGEAGSHALQERGIKGIPRPVKYCIKGSSR